MNLKLKCSCGAEFEIVGEYEPTVMQQAKEWQDRHVSCASKPNYVPPIRFRGEAVPRAPMEWPYEAPQRDDKWYTTC